MPAEMYTYGTQFWMIITSEGLVSITMAVAYLPVFYKLQITTSYEGGLKAVVWTDTVQTVVMVGALIVVMTMGTINGGGFAEVWKRNKDGGRLDFFNFDLDPTIRHTFWTVSIGNYFAWLASCSINQAMVQRCLAMPSLAKAHVTVGILVVGIMTLVSMCCYMGLLIFAAYHKCDPVTRGAIVKSDQLLPYYVMHITSSLPGLPGLFVSGVFSAALSSMSTGLNSMTGVIFEDLIKPYVKRPLSEAKASFLMKIIVVIIGTICVAMVFVVEKMGALIQASGSLGAITAGPLLGIFSLGMFFPSANPLGALVGGIVSGSLITWISIGTQLQMAKGLIRFPQKPVSVEGCSANWITEYLNLALHPDSTPKILEPPFVLYRLSYMYYTAVGCLTAITVGIIVSYLSGRNKHKVHRDLFSPVIHRFLKDEEPVDNNVNIAENIKLNNL
ncbi:sodium-coupled monocarboxylate transporter [Holotrichia oblita]|uniref:Sodium-coupled monocarboxylate transporter n=1 Tax=Holotrichia oblita TaxID=644536 RepID=A0ACB9TF90_HOLOL|nr:sodium-coupled monocarboxylate transporter [Holotrichia oblita]